jgi:hypothetical protein
VADVVRVGLAAGHPAVAVVAPWAAERLDRLAAALRAAGSPSPAPRSRHLLHRLGHAV